MNRIAKQIAVYSLVGILQVGFGASIIEASPVHKQPTQKKEQFDREHGRGHDNEQKKKQEEQREQEEQRKKEAQRKHDERKREENERHEREMKRRVNESEHEWRERQEREKERHNNSLREIATLLIGIAIGSANQ